MKLRLSCPMLILLAGCAVPPPPTAVNPAIMAEMNRAAEPRPGPVAQPPDAALLPPLRLDMPDLRGRPVDPRFDLSVNGAPASQVFMSLAAGTRYSMLLHPEVSGSITVSLRDVTVLEAMDSLRELYGYDFRIDGTRIMVQPAGIQSRIYRVNYLPSQRRGTTELRVQSGSVADTVGGGAVPPMPATPMAPVPGTGPGGQPMLPGMRAVEATRVSTHLVSDFWGELRSALVSIVGDGQGRNVVVSPHSGVILVRAMPSELRAVEKYLRETRLAIERQVMLEAKIIEVTLSEQFQSGINWSAFRNSGPSFAVGQASNAVGRVQLEARGGPPTAITGGGQSFDLANRLAITTGTALAASNPASAVFGFAFQTSNFAALLQFLETHGQVQVLSSPRVATLNNQKAVLKVGTDEFFVTNVATVTTVTGIATQQTPTVTVAPFFSGILLDVTPQVDDNDNVTLHVRPAVSEVTESQRVVSLGGTIPSITLPLARSQVSETDTIVRVANGNIVAIGGLMSVDVRDNRGGVPGVESFLLRNAVRQSRKRELVILLRPTVITDDRVWEQDVRDTRDRLQRFIPPRQP